MLTFIAGMRWLSKNGILPQNVDYNSSVWGLPISCYSRVVVDKRDGRGKESGEEGMAWEKDCLGQL